MEEEEEDEKKKKKKNCSWWKGSLLNTQEADTSKAGRKRKSSEIESKDKSLMKKTKPTPGPKKPGSTK